MEHFSDEYEYYNFDMKATALCQSRKGRSKRESSLNTNRFNPGGHERKLLVKMQNTEKKRKHKIWRNLPRTDQKTVFDGSKKILGLACAPNGERKSFRDETQQRNSLTEAC